MPNNKVPQKKSAQKKKAEKDVTDIYVVKDKVEELKIKEYRWTPNQRSLISLINDPKVRFIWVSGMAGTGKTLVSVFAGLKLLQEKKINEIVYMRSAVESSARSIGFLPGGLEEKTGVYNQALIEKLDKLLPITQVNALLNEETIKTTSNGFIRGCEFSNLVIVDEAQNFEAFELTTIVTRLAEGGKMILCGDFSQSDLKGKSGFKKFFDLFNDAESKSMGIENITFGPEDCMRSKILSFICDKIESSK